MVASQGRPRPCAQRIATLDSREPEQRIEPGGVRGVAHRLVGTDLSEFGEWHWARAIVCRVVVGPAEDASAVESPAAAKRGSERGRGWPGRRT